MVSCGFLLIGCDLDRTAAPKSGAEEQSRKQATAEKQPAAEDLGPKEPFIQRGYDPLKFGAPYRTTLTFATSWYDGELSYVVTMEPTPAESVGKVTVELLDPDSFAVYKFPILGIEFSEIEGQHKREVRGIIKMPWKQFGRVCCWTASLGPAVPIVQ